MKNDIEKMTIIYEKYKKVMFAVAMKILQNPHDAEDAVHNAIPPIMRNLDAIKDVRSPSPDAYHHLPVLSGIIP